MKLCGIYVIKNIINNKVYVGSSIDIRLRWNCHRSDLRNNKNKSKILQFAWNKYGESNFEFLILEIVNDVNKLVEREQYWMDKYQSYIGKYGYNIGRDAEVPMRGRKLGKKARDNMSKASLKRGQSKKQKQQLKRLQKHSKGKHHSEDWNLKIKKSNKNTNKGRRPWNKDKTKYNDIRLKRAGIKIRNANKGRKKPPRTKQHCKNLSKSLTGRIVTKETRLKQSRSSKRYHKRKRDKII